MAERESEREACMSEPQPPLSVERRFPSTGNPLPTPQAHAHTSPVYIAGSGGVGVGNDPRDENQACNHPPAEERIYTTALSRHLTQPRFILDKERFPSLRAPGLAGCFPSVRGSDYDTQNSR